MNFSSFKTILAILVFAFVVFSQNANAQNPEWLSYYNGKNVTAVAADGNFVWLGTSVGNLVKLNITNGAMTFFNKANAGLPGSKINCMVKDTSGILWLGTDKGLVKFNGTSSIIYTTANSTLPGNKINSIQFSAIDNLKWMTTANSLVSFNNAAFTIYNISNSDIHSANLNCVGIDQFDNLWIGGDLGLDMRTYTNVWNWFTPQNSDLPDIIVQAVTFAEPNIVAIGTNHGGLAIKRDDEWTIYDMENSPLTTNNITSLSTDGGSNIFIGTAEGLFVLSGNAIVPYYTDNSILPDNHINCLGPDEGGAMCVGTLNGFVRVPSLISWVAYNPSNLIMPDSDIRFAAMDMSGYKWFVSNGSGVYMWDATTWTPYKYGTSGLPSDNVYSVSVDKWNNKWFATDSGLAKFNGTSWTVYRAGANLLPSDNVRVIDFEGNNVWVGTNDAGLARFNGSTWVRFNTTNSNIPSNNVTSIAVDVYGNKWIGTFNSGVAKFDGTIWTPYTTTNSLLPSNAIKQIFIDNSGIRWFATAGGAASMNQNVWTAYTTSNSGITSNDILSVAVEANGTRWFVANNTGLVKFDGTNWTIYDESNSPLTVNSVKHLFIDPSNNKWISTFGGGLFVHRTGGVLPTVSTPELFGPFCVGQQLDIIYKAFASSSFVNMGTGNIFTAQLSDGNRSFGTPATLGTLTSEVSDTISCRIPDSLVYSTAYRMRVISSNPALVNNDNGVDITIYELPNPVIIGPANVCANGVEAYRTNAVPGITFEWFINGGTINGSSTDSLVNVTWGVTGSASLGLVHKTAAGCLDTAILNVTISSRPPKNIKGDTNVCANRYEVYETVEDSTMSNDWYAVGGEVITKPSNNTVKVLWGIPGNGKLKLVQTTKNGCRDSMTITIHKFISPSTAFTGPDTAKYGSVKTYSTPVPVPGITNKWSVVGGKINGNSTQNNVSITWDNGPTGTVKLVQQTAAGCKDSAEKEVFIYQPMAVTGDRIVCENLLEDYYVGSNLEAVPLWSVTGGKIEGADNKRIMNVTWGAAGKGSVRLIQTYTATGYKDTLEFQVQINPKPGKPTISEKDGTLTSSIDVGNNWFYNGVKIRDANGKTHYTEERSGVYTVQVSDSVPCFGDMSDPFNFVSDVEELGFGNSGIKVYPNPTNGIINFSFTGSFEKVDVSVIDMLGKSVAASSFSGIDNNFRALDIAGFADGVYVIIIKTGSQQYQQRIILKH